ncbi:hypothetical protein EE612_050241 [Oryza sativa]|nr:hypothetical protein EE612_050241 [Oryza sativa]
MIGYMLMHTWTDQAYVTQDNVLMATLTVREAIYYSAQIQLPPAGHHVDGGEAGAR